MKRILLALTFLTPLLAHAADMPLKAPFIQRAPIFYGGSGFYAGIGTGGEATKIAATGAVATYEAGALLNMNAGYVMSVGDDRFLAFQVNYARSNTDANPCVVAVDCKVDHRQSGDFKVMYGAPLSVLSGIFSNAAAGFPALPGIPVGAINNTMHPYISVGAWVTQDRVNLAGLVDEHKTKIRGLLGVGAIYQTNTNTTVNTFADWTWGSGKFLLQQGAEIDVGSTFRFGVVVNYGVGG